MPGRVFLVVSWSLVAIVLGFVLVTMLGGAVFGTRSCTLACEFLLLASFGEVEFLLQ